LYSLHISNCARNVSTDPLPLNLSGFINFFGVGFVVTDSPRFGGEGGDGRRPPSLRLGPPASCSHHCRRRVVRVVGEPLNLLLQFYIAGDPATFIFKTFAIVSSLLTWGEQLLCRKLIDCCFAYWCDIEWLKYERRKCIGLSLHFCLSYFSHSVSHQ